MKNPDDPDIFVSPCLSTIHLFRIETKDKSIPVSIETGTFDLQFWVSFPFWKKISQSYKNVFFRQKNITQFVFTSL